MTHIVHWDDVEWMHRAAGEISSSWKRLGEGAGTVTVGLNRIRVDPGCRSTAFHVHGAEEEIFYVLGGSGRLLQGDLACEVAPGDCVVHLPEKDAHTLRAGPDGLDVLVFGTRVPVEICYLPRAKHAWAGPTVVQAPGIQNLWAYDAAAGTLEFPATGPRPPNVVRTEGVAATRTEKGRSRLMTRDLGRAAGSLRTGLDHVTLGPGSTGWPPHCHAAEEEVFVILDGEGICRLGDDEHPVRAGHVVSRPPGTGIAHSFEGVGPGMTYLAYGTREPNDIAYFPRSGKVYLRGVGVIGRITPLDYWEGES